MPFARISEIFEKIMLVKYSPKLDYVERARYQVNRVALELQRVSEHNSIENGLLIPVWNFYGVFHCEYTDGTVYTIDDTQGFSDPFLSINAIDGSVIDVNKGF